MYSGSCSKPKGKCSHGGLLDMITQTDAIDFGINKDNGNSDHGSFHTLATKISSVGNDTFGRFLDFHSTSFVIVIDTTGKISNTSTVAICHTTLSQRIKRESNNAYRPLLIASTINQSDLVLVISYNNLRSSIQSATIELVNKHGEKYIRFAGIEYH
ncbi:unnamed protein product [Rotaria sordida]|uniref:VWA7 N-terminal domain-containing protein n=1 Tax=Rotaria sordida TaxID=392033 RepID=A0A813RU35_9BILA|nr:unnamed protein product [Rotaria sordida]CAF0789966.1 unnamed protein product [Rotaria sordida]CAF0791373.1 unnamed protein product [Rotaria sordida]